jgi:predicted transcriptional regulator
MAKLTERDVREIRASGEGQIALGKRYGVSQPRISKIIRGEGWAHI